MNPKHLISVPWEFFTRESWLPYRNLPVRCVKIIWTITQCTLHNCTVQAWDTVEKKFIFYKDFWKSNIFPLPQPGNEIFPSAYIIIHVIISLTHTVYLFIIKIMYRAQNVVTTMLFTFSWGKLSNSVNSNDIFDLKVTP